VTPGQSHAIDDIPINKVAVSQAIVSLRCGWRNSLISRLQQSSGEEKSCFHSKSEQESFAGLASLLAGKRSSVTSP